jgi:hypothetical protein
LLNHPNITFWGDLDIAGIEIFLRLRRSIPGLHLSALYKPMLEWLDAPASAHPYVFAVGKHGQPDRYSMVRCEEAIATAILAKCSTRAVDQECVSPEHVEQYAAHDLALGG